MTFKVLFYKVEKIEIFPFDIIEIDKGVGNGQTPEIIVTDFGILSDEEEKEILNYLEKKPIYIHIGEPEKKPFYSNFCFNLKWERDSIEWFGLKVLNDLLMTKAKELENFNEFINTIRANSSGFFCIKSALKRISFILKEKSLIFLNHSENDLFLANLVLNSNLGIKFNIDEIIFEQYEKGKFLGEILIEKNIIDEKILNELLTSQMEKVATNIAQAKNQEYFFAPLSEEIAFSPKTYLNFSQFLMVYLKHLNSMPANKPIFLLKDTVLKSESFEEKKEISISPTQFYILNECKNPIEVKKLFYIIPGDEKEKEKDITYLYAFSLLSVVKEGQRLNPFEEVLKLLQEKDKLNLYEILDVKEDAPLEDIRNAYFKAAKKYHPDKFSSYPEFFKIRLKLEDFFATINQAYQILSNKEERKKYDLELKGEVKKEIRPEEKAKELFFEAKKAISAKQNQLALQKLSEIVYLKQADWRVYQLLGKLYMEENKLKEAEQALKNSLNLEEKQYETHTLLGHLYLKVGLKQRAIKSFQRAIELNPANFEAKEKLNELL